MWISKQIVEAGKKRPAADVSRIRSPGEEDAGNDRTRVVYCGPWGVAYTPPSYAQAVTVETRQGIACVGTVMEKPEEGMVEPGELLLFSKTMGRWKSTGRYSLLCKRKKREAADCALHER